MIGIMNLPNLAYWYLAANQKEFWVISSLVGIEKLDMASVLQPF